MSNDLQAAQRQGMAIAYWARNRPDHPAVISPAGNRTFARLNGNGNRLARALADHGLRAGDHVAILCSNRPEYAEVYAAVFRSGMKIIPINWHLNTDDITYIIDNSDAKAFIADSTLDAPLAAIRGAINVSLALSIGPATAGYNDYHQTIEQYSGEDIPSPSLGDRMFYTSGTTGKPKGVIKTFPPTSTIGIGFIPGDSVVLCTGPFYHAAPFSGTLARPLDAGVTIVIMERFDAETTLQLIEKHKITHMHMVATMFHRLLALPEEVRERYDVSSLVRVNHGAAPTPIPVKRAMLDWWGPVIYEYYASTEGPGATISPEEWLRKPGSVGKPPAGTAFILDDEGRELHQGETGTVYHRPSGGTFYYYKDDAKRQAAFQGDRYTVGDHGYFDEDGYLFLTGRSSEVIISGGVNIYPAEIDGVLLTHPAIADGATVGVPNQEFGEEVKGVVELRPGFSPSPELATAIVGYCRERLAHYKCPRSIDFIQALPRSEAGKVYRNQVRAPYWTDHSTASRH